MTDQLETRLHALEKSQVRTEATMEQQGKRLDKLDTDFKQMNEILEGILNTLNQIKWVGTGIGLAVVAQSVGIVEVLKNFMLP